MVLDKRPVKPRMHTILLDFTSHVQNIHSFKTISICIRILYYTFRFDHTHVFDVSKSWFSMWCLSSGIGCIGFGKADLYPDQTTEVANVRHLYLICHDAQVDVSRRQRLIRKPESKLQENRYLSANSPMSFSPRPCIYSSTNSTYNYFIRLQHFASMAFHLS